MKSIICYSLGGIAPKLRTKFNRELYGYKDKSNHGNYHYQREGIIGKNYKKPLDSVIILDSGINKVLTHLKKYGAKYVTYDLK